jgi:hypothetical protein
VVAFLVSWSSTIRSEDASSGGARNHPRLHRQQTFALQLFAGEFAGAADRFRLLPNSPLRGLFVMTAQLHLAENALALHLLLQHLEGLVDVVAMDENLHSAFLFDRAIDWGRWPRRPGHWRTEQNNPDANGARGARPPAAGWFRFSLNLKIERFGMAHRSS